METKLLKVKKLSVAFQLIEGRILAVENVGFDVGQGEIVGVLGESGCGKSVTVLSIVRLVSFPGRIVEGSIDFANRNLLSLSEEEINQIRGNEIAMIFQEPMTSLNPVFKIGDQISEAIQLHQKVSKRTAYDKTLELLRKVGIPSSERRYYQYPHQLSGGIRQRVMIAMALSCNPKLLIADEPTTALDVTIQIQILDLIRAAQRESGMSILLITHDLGVIAEAAHRVIVMYAGQIVEESCVRSLFDDPLHPYTQGLLNSIPNVKVRQKRLPVVEGIVPHPLNFPPGCRFHPRCEEALSTCIEKNPKIISMDDSRKVRCWLYYDT
jgi:oligopeptide/dipeptide ABC transporter ATP-binding protein